ncbi:hypothetical protein PHMEG_00020442 [Phytophthora megakarya]|uniref:Uncharacterized protein n=1 Tax=Phytophthora megakarya TaxID=4795 RepID=A0A225VQX1_9STRA|nr:hypothetical protein PHMEG_00020442 [Phytophthora megakarya]
MLALTKSLHIVPCLEGPYMVRFTDTSTRPDHVIMRRTISLRAGKISAVLGFHAVKASVHHGMHMSELFDFVRHATVEYRKVYFHQLLPLVNDLVIDHDTTLRIPDVLLAKEETGKTWKEARSQIRAQTQNSTTRVDTCASPIIAMTQ